MVKKYIFTKKNVTIKLNIILGKFNLFLYQEIFDYVMIEFPNFINKSSFIKCQTRKMSVRFETGDFLIFPGL